MAQQLQRKGQTVALLFMIDSLGPGLPLEIRWQASRSRLEVQTHLRTLFRLKPQEILNYVFMRLKGKSTAHLEKLKIIKTIATRRLTNTLIKIYLTLGLRLPYSLRGQYIWTVIDSALAKYTPTPYPGRAIYVRSEERDPEHAARWSRLIIGGLEVHKVANSGHRDIVSDVYARVWVEKLKACLLEAQQRVPLYNSGHRGALYSMTSSARDSSDGGIVIPSAFAVLLFMTNSNRVACRNGKSVGRAPFRICATCSAAFV
jgi:thioesterase domain-containing protein